MMKAFTIGLLSGAIALSGCGTTGGITPITIPIAIADVQNAAVTACGFLPTATTITSILAVNDPALTTAVAVAQAICAAVAAAPKAGAKRGLAKPSIDGVIISGTFIQ